MRLSNVLRAAVVGASVLLAPVAARAEVIGFTGVGKASVVTIAGLYNGAVYAGELNWSWIGGTPSGFVQNFYAYCVDLQHDLQSVQSVTIGAADSLGLSGAPYVADAGDKAAWLFNTYATTIHQSGTAIQAAALQVAIWEALYDTARDVTSGAFRLVSGGAVATQANAYLTALYSSDYSNASQAVLFTNGGQDQITARVTEPSTLLLLGSGLLLYARRQRRLKKQHS